MLYTVWEYSTKTFSNIAATSAMLLKYCWNVAMLLQYCWNNLCYMGPIQHRSLQQHCCDVAILLEYFVLNGSDRRRDLLIRERHSRLSGVNQLDGFAASSGTSGTPGQLPLTSFQTLPAKSNLKRRLTDCMEGDESRGNVDEPLKKKRNIQFDAVTVYYFPRAQGFTCVPSQVSQKIGFSLPSSFLSARSLCTTFAIRLPFLPFTSVS